MNKQIQSVEALDVKEHTEVKPLENKTAKRLQFKNLGTMREMQERIKNSEVLNETEQKSFDEILNKVRERWIMKNT